MVLVIEAAVVLAVVLAIGYGAYWALSASKRPQPPLAPSGSPAPPLVKGARWRSHHFADDGHTVVAVARVTPAGDVIEHLVVARIEDLDEDWSRKFLAAKQEAEERAFHLNAEG